MAKEKLPAILIYPGDWLKDSVSGCSLAAQGLWLRLMFVMHESERYGYIPLDTALTQVEALARRCGCTAQEFAAHFMELVSASVPSSDPGGCFYSRRMVRDAEIRRIRSESGKKGGRPPSRESKTKAKRKQNTEDEYEIDIVSCFESLWGQYPNKDGKKEAFKHFKSSVNTQLNYQDCQKALKNYIASPKVKAGYIKNGSTWFNNWEDWIDVPGPKIESEQERRHRFLSENRCIFCKGGKIEKSDAEYRCNQCNADYTQSMGLKPVSEAVESTVKLLKEAVEDERRLS